MLTIDQIHIEKLSKFLLLKFEKILFKNYNYSASFFFKPYTF